MTDLMLQVMSATRKQVTLLFALLVTFVLCPIGFAASEEAIKREAIPYDESANAYKIVDGGGRFKKHVFLKDTLLSNIVWLDNKYIIATIGPRSWVERNEAENSGWRYKSYALGQIVVVDTESGDIKDFGYEISGGVMCHSDGNVIISSGGDEEIRKVVISEQSVELQPVSRPTGKRINRYDCSFEDYIEPLDKPKNVLGQVVSLKARHGQLVSHVNYDDVTPVARVHIEKPSGERFDISTNEGEARFEVSYIKHEDAYFVVPNLRNQNGYTPYWRAHPKALFLRVLYPDGNVKRIPVPYLLEKKLSDQSSFGYSDLAYTKRGPLWSLRSGSVKSFFPPTIIFYLQTENELIEIQDEVSTVSPDGCKLIAPYVDNRMTAKMLKNVNYYTVDLCESY